MNFKINPTKNPMTISVMLGVCYVFMLALLFWGINEFIAWNMPSNSYFRALLINCVFILFFSYLNKENR